MYKYTYINVINNIMYNFKYLIYINIGKGHYKWVGG